MTSDADRYIDAKTFPYTRPSPEKRGLLEDLQRSCEYDPEGDSSVDALIDYKDALEDLVGRVNDLMQGEGPDGDVNGGDLVEELGAMGFGQ